MKTKVFCVGFHKTGTTSLKWLLRKLGYQVQRAYKTRDPEFVAKLARGDLEELYQVAERAEAFCDNPWPIFFRELDERFPGSRFILTLRDPDSWIKSAVNHFGSQPEPNSPMRKLIYGAPTPVGNERVYLERFRRHNEAVRSYFSGRGGDLLAIDLKERDGLRPICDFLGVRKPWLMWRMPHRNRRLR